MGRPYRGDFLPFYRSLIVEKLMALFLLPIKGTKEKAKHNENAVKDLSPSAEGDQRLCLWIPPGRAGSRSSRFIHLKVRSSPETNIRQKVA